MPIVNPASNDPKPADWRWAWQEFQALRAIATKAKIDVSQWKLEFPSRVQRLVDPRWRMTYTTPSNQLLEIYIGSTGKLAGQTIKKLIPAYAQKVKARVIQTSDKPTDPMFNPVSVKRALETWNQEIAKVRSLQDQRAFEERYPKLIALMKRRAGFLSMSLQEYLTRHPHSNLFPTPPKTKEEYDKRNRAFEKHVKARDDGRKQQKDAHGSDWIPTY